MWRNAIDLIKKLRIKLEKKLHIKLNDVKLSGVENEIDVKYRNRRQHACGSVYDPLAGSCD
jgi:hypothetical protein